MSLDTEHRKSAFFPEDIKARAKAFARDTAEPGPQSKRPPMRW